MTYPKLNERLIYTAYTKHQWPEVQQWCNDNIGPWNETWYKLGEDPAAAVFDPDYRSTYFFKTEQDQLLFMLRWGT